MRNCVTHYFACDCREADFKKMKEENERLKRVLQIIASDEYQGGIEDRHWLATEDAKEALEKK
jgi:hypothetical protein